MAPLHSNGKATAASLVVPDPFLLEVKTLGEPRFTKGPWRVEGFENRSVYAPAYGAIAVVGNQATALGYKESERQPHVEIAQANAALIASAPALYEALKRAEQFILNGIEFGYVKRPTAGSRENETLPLIRAALSLANPSPTDSEI